MDDLSSLRNVSFGLNFTSILDFLPSRFLARFISKSKPVASQADLDLGALPTISDFIATSDWETPLALAAPSEPANVKTKTSAASSDERSLLLGPLGFFTSGYMLGLFLMAFVLHRLHHTMIPSRLSRRGRRHARLYSGRAIIFIRIYRSIFPIDMSRSLTRFILQLPTLYCLLRMLLLWGLVISQTSELYPETFPAWIGGDVAGVLQRLGKWSAHKPMDEVCWISFCSLSAAYFVESFVRKLDELANGTIEEVHLGRQMSPYNLVAHSFVLYLFSLSASHVHKPEGLPSRPDPHALVTMGIPLLQSTIFHFLCVSKKYSNHRLIPTALTSFLGLLHFHTTLITRGYPAVFLPLISDKDKENVFAGTGFRSSYPLMNYFNCLIETALMSIIFLTVFLNALVQLLVNGRVDRLFTSLGIAAAGDLPDGIDSEPMQFSWSNLPFEEEWGVVLMRLGTASLEATGLRGWGNELAPLSAPSRSALGRRRRQPPPLETQVTYGVVRMGRSGVGKIIPGQSVPGPNSSRADSLRGRASKPVTLRGWNNEVRSVETNANTSARRTTEGERWVWLREVMRFTKAISGVVWGLMRLGWRWACRSPRSKGCEEEQRRQTHVSDAAAASGLNTTIEDSQSEEEELYRRFLRGEDISDDEGEEAAVDASDGDDNESESVLSSENGVEGTGEDSVADAAGPEQQEREEEAITLFTDLVRTQGVDEGSKMVLSHLVYGSRATGREAPAPPLTRRRWGEMIERGKRWGLEIADGLDEDRDVWELNPGKRDMGAEGEKEADWTDRAMCIICTSRSRDIVSWPCRCLAMCDQCREVLAARGSPGKHYCPCCRQPIDGYSRIFIP